MGVLSRQQRLELLWGFHELAANPLFDLRQNELDCLQGARRLLGKGDAEILCFLLIGVDGVLPQIPNGQAGGSKGDCDDANTDQREKTVTRGLMPQAFEKLHQPIFALTLRRTTSAGPTGAERRA